MRVNFVTDAQREKNVTPATFSFNLPRPAAIRDRPDALAALAQSFVDDLVARLPEGVKPCVSFGQDNTLVYATVPATSTQGVISEEDKAKQAIGGVQLVRFSFPPNMDMKAWKDAVDATVKSTYQSSVQSTRDRSLRTVALGATILAVVAVAAGWALLRRSETRRNGVAKRR